MLAEQKQIKKGMEGGGGHTGLFNLGMWYFDPNRPFQSEKDKKYGFDT